MDLDFIIIGQGLSGSILSYKLLQRGYKVKIFDDGNNHASSVAAGLFNPITGKRWVKTWLAEEIFKVIPQFYLRLQQHYKQEFYFPKSLYRPFNTLREQNEWAIKSHKELSLLFVKEMFTVPIIPEIINNPFGGIMIKDAGYINVPNLLKVMKSDFKEHNILVPELFEYQKMIIRDDKIYYKDLSSARIIFCTGISSASAGYFSELPFNAVKGEILTVEMGIEINFIVSRGIFIIPEQKNLYKVGATYDRENINVEITGSGKNYLVARLKKIINSDVTVIDQVAGIRPATRDRRPFIGMHPKFKNVGIFNGFGSKGVSLIPYLSDQFIAHLESGVKLDPEINIMRYFN